MIECLGPWAHPGHQIPGVSLDEPLVSFEFDQEAAGRSRHEEINFVVASVLGWETEARKRTPWLVLGEPFPYPLEGVPLVRVRRLALFKPVFRHPASS